jgi:CHAT domain-containing protein
MGVGTLKAEALREAQLALLHGPSQPVKAGDNGGRGIAGELDRRKMSNQGKGDQKTTFAHPFFWAPFTLIGNWK